MIIFLFLEIILIASARGVWVPLIMNRIYEIMWALIHKETHKYFTLTSPDLCTCYCLHEQQ